METVTEEAVAQVSQESTSGTVPPLEERYEFWNALCMQILFTTDCHVIFSAESEFCL